MDPFPQGYPHHLPKVTPIEETMIARVHVVMKCYQMQGTGHMRYEGNVINLEKETNLLSVLPAAFNEIPTVFVVRINNPNAPTNAPNHRDFRCRREVVRAWLTYLKAHHPCYENITLEMARIDALPVDGNVSNQIPQVVHVVRPNNERTQGTQAKEGEEDAAAEEEQVPQQQVLEPGPDTSGATGAVGLDAGEVVVDDKVYIPQSLTNMNGLDSDRIRQFVLNGIPQSLTNMNGLDSEWRICCSSWP